MPTFIQERVTHTSMAASIPAVSALARQGGGIGGPDTLCGLPKATVTVNDGPFLSVPMIAMFSESLYSKRRAFPPHLDAQVSLEEATFWQRTQAEHDLRRRKWGMLYDLTGEQMETDAEPQRTRADALSSSVLQSLAPLELMLDTSRWSMLFTHLLRVSAFYVHELPRAVTINLGALRYALEIVRMVAYVEQMEVGVACMAKRIWQARVALREVDGGVRRVFLCTRGSDAVLRVSEAIRHEAEVVEELAPEAVSLYALTVATVARGIMGLGTCGLTTPLTPPQESQLVSRLETLVKCLLCEIPIPWDADGAQTASLVSMIGSHQADRACETLCRFADSENDWYGGSYANAEAMCEKLEFTRANECGMAVFGSISAVALRVIWPCTISRFAEQIVMNSAF